MKLAEIEKFFSTYEYKKGQVIRIDKCTKVIDLQKFINSSIGHLKGNSGNKRYLPYWDRLLKVYNILKHE